MVGCTNPVDVDDEVGDTSDASEASSSSDSTSSDSTSSDSTSSDSTSSEDDSGFVPLDTDSTGGLGDPGQACASTSDCAEGLFCTQIQALGMVCSECTSDADCGGDNCTLSNEGYLECGDGSLGQSCETDEVCAEGLSCAQVFASSACSECKDDGECVEGQLCAPLLDLDHGFAHRTCIEPNTHPDDQFCDPSGAGDQQCEGFCTQVFGIGLCGECETDADCQDGTCTPAEFGAEGFLGSSCE
ncbi:hypothetical protein ACNOYE_24735 [Nannocystaceae bacterium ST9]